MNKHGKDHNVADQDLNQEKHPMQNPQKTPEQPPDQNAEKLAQPASTASATDPAGDNRRQPSVVDKFVIRLPQGLRDQIRELSENNRRSMNSEIIMVLEQYIQQHATTASENQIDNEHGEDQAETADFGRDSDQSGLPAGEQSLDEKLKSLPPEKKAALLSLLT